MPLHVHRRQRAHPLRIILSTAPSVEPISTAEAKTHLKVDVSDDDTLIATLVASARRSCEEYTNRALIDQSWTLFMDFWPGAGADDPLWEGTREGPETILGGHAQHIELPKAPLDSVTSIKTYDDSDNDTEFSSDNYFVDTASEPARVALRTGQSWPIPTRTVNGIEIIFKAGYGTAGSDVPDDLLRGMYLLIGHMYENREQVVVGAAANELPFGVMSFWDPKRIVSV